MHWNVSGDIGLLYLYDMQQSSLSAAHHLTHQNALVRVERCIGREQGVAAGHDGCGFAQAQRVEQALDVFGLMARHIQFLLFGLEQHVHHLGRPRLARFGLGAVLKLCAAFGRHEFGVAVRAAARAAVGGTAAKRFGLDIVHLLTSR